MKWDNKIVVLDGIKRLIETVFNEPINKTIQPELAL